MSDIEESPNTVLVLRVCATDGSSSRGFLWPRSGPVVAPDWDPNPVCGGGLHGWLWGAGDTSVACGVADPTSLWLVVEVPASGVMELGGKVKFRSGDVVYAGDLAGAAALIATRAPAGTAIIENSRRIWPDWRTVPDGEPIEHVREASKSERSAPDLLAEIERLRRETERLRHILGRVTTWTCEYGASLIPPGADTYGEGMRDAKDRVKDIIADAAESPPTADAWRNRALALLGIIESTGGFMSMDDQATLREVRAARDGQ